MNPNLLTAPLPALQHPIQKTFLLLIQAHKVMKLAQQTTHVRLRMTPQVNVIVIVTLLIIRKLLQFLTAQKTIQNPQPTFLRHRNFFSIHTTVILLTLIYQNRYQTVLENLLLILGNIERRHLIINDEFLLQLKCLHLKVQLQFRQP